MSGTESLQKQSKRRIVTQLTRRGSEQERSFSRQFWRDAGHEAIFSAAWEIVSEVELFRGHSDVGQPRLQRSVQNIHEEKVEYLVVGAHAVMFYTEPRYTKALDV